MTTLLQRPAEDVVELRFRTSRHVRYYCSWVGEDGQPVMRTDVRKVITMLELMLDTFDDDAPDTPETPPSEYGDHPDDPDAGVFEREPEPVEGLDTPAEPDEGQG